MFVEWLGRGDSPEDGLSSSTPELVSGVHPSAPRDELAQILVGTALHLITFKEYFKCQDTSWDNHPRHLACGELERVRDLCV